MTASHPSGCLAASTAGLPPSVATPLTPSRMTAHPLETAASTSPGSTPMSCQEWRVRLGQGGRQARLALRESRDHPVLPARQDPLAVTVLLDLPDLKGRKVSLGLPVPMVNLVPWDLPGRS